MQLYKISFPPQLTEKAYIGISSKGAVRRLQQHIGSKKDYPIVQAIRKYGAENVILEVLGDYDDFDSLYLAEQEAIKQYGTKSPNGYNLTDGGKGVYGLPASKERKRKISEANKGRKLSIEARLKISQANRGRDFSVQVAAMAEANRGKSLDNERKENLRSIWVGRRHTEEAKHKMSYSASNRVASAETRRRISEGVKMAKGGRVFNVASPSGDVYQVINVREFCASHGLKPPRFYCLVNGKNSSYKGWTCVSVK